MALRWIVSFVMIVFMVTIGDSTTSKTTKSTTKKSTTTKPIVLPPNNTAGLVVYNYTLNRDSAQYPKGYIQCPITRKYFWESVVTRKPIDLYENNLLAQNILSYYGDVCDNFCFCTIDGTCFTPSSKRDYNLWLVPYCDDGSCFIYGIPYTGSWNSSKRNLSSIWDAKVEVGSNSSYVKVTSIGCGSCTALKALSCSGSYLDMATIDQSCSVNETYTDGEDNTCDSPPNHYADEDYSDMGSGRGIGHNIGKRSSDFSGSGSEDENQSGSGNEEVSPLGNSENDNHESGSAIYYSYEDGPSDPHNPWPSEKCYCNQGYLRKSDGKCVKPVDCKPENIKCGANEVWDPCGYEQTNTCDPEPYYFRCGEYFPKCVCQKGFVRQNGTCVDKSNVGANKGCAVNQECTSTSRSREAICNDPYSISQRDYYVNAYDHFDYGTGSGSGYYEDSSVTSCTCKDGYYRHENGTCVKDADCKPDDVTCDTNEVWTSCFVGEPTCEDPKNTTKTKCTDYYTNRARCVCKEVFVRGWNGTCVTASQCRIGPKNITCGDNEYFDSCGRCDANCYFVKSEQALKNYSPYSHYEGSGYNEEAEMEYYRQRAWINLNPKFASEFTKCFNTTENKGRCRCQTGFVRVEGKCVKYDACDAYNLTAPECTSLSSVFSSAPPTQELKIFSSVDSTCENPDPVSVDNCGAPKCQCVAPNYVRDKWGRCTLRWNCNAPYYFPNCDDIKCGNITMNNETIKGQCIDSGITPCFETYCAQAHYCADTENIHNLYASYGRYQNLANSKIDCAQVTCPDGYTCVTRMASFNDNYKGEMKSVNMSVCMKKT